MTSIPSWTYIVNPLLPSFWILHERQFSSPSPALISPISLLSKSPLSVLSLSSCCSLSCSHPFAPCVLFVSHRPGRAFAGFGGYQWYPPGLAPPAALATRVHSIHFFWPQSFILLQFQIALLAFSAASPICLSFLLLSPPSIPRSLRRETMDDAGKPLQPTSTVHTAILKQTENFWK